MPEISVVVPVYNAESTIEKCVKSIREQSFSDIEIILINDGSSDRSGELCDCYAMLDERITVVHQENKGVSYARNTGMAYATGKYILFIDSDDFVDHDYAFMLLSGQADLTICSLQYVDISGHLKFTIRYNKDFTEGKNNIPFFSYYSQNMLYSPYCKLFRSSIIKEHNLRFDERISWGEDGMFVADYIEHVNSINVIDYVGYFYLSYDNSQSLANRVRKDVVDMITLSREYCITKMKTTSPDNYEQVKKVCQEDIRNNCTYFVKKLLDNSLMSRNEKVSILSHFMSNKYVMETIQQKEKYYRNHQGAQLAFRMTNPYSIILLYPYLPWMDRIYCRCFKDLGKRLLRRIKRLFT